MATCTVGTLTQLRAAGFLAYRSPTGPICVVEVGGTLYALDDECPHMGSDLHRGAIVEGTIVCPWHRARFELATGKSLDLYAGDVRCYAVTVVDGDVVVDTTPGTGRVDGDATLGEGRP